MDYVKLGTTGLDVSPVAIGAMTYGEPGRGHPVWSLGEEESRLLIKHAIGQGINFFDTANIYSQGSSEEILGRAGLGPVEHLRLLGPQKLGAEGYPPSLEVLVEGVKMAGQVEKKMRFLRRIPKDPMTHTTDWGKRSMQDDPKSIGWGGQNVFDVYTNSTDRAGDGTSYSEW